MQPGLLTVLSSSIHWQSIHTHTLKMRCVCVCVSEWVSESDLSLRLEKRSINVVHLPVAIYWTLQHVLSLLSLSISPSSPLSPWQQLLQWQRSRSKVTASLFKQKHGCCTFWPFKESLSLFSQSRHRCVHINVQKSQLCFVQNPGLFVWTRLFLIICCFNDDGLQSQWSSTESMHKAFSSIIIPYISEENRICVLNRRVLSFGCTAISCV